MRRFFNVVIVSLAGLLGPAIANAQTQPASQPAPATKPVRPAGRPVGVRVNGVAGQVDFRDQMRDQQKKTIANYAAEPKHTLGELIRFRMKDGQLVADWTGALMTNTPVRFECEGSKATWVVQSARRMAAGRVGLGRAVPAPAGDDGPVVVSMARFDFDNPDPSVPWSIQFNMSLNTNSFQAQYGNKSEIYSVTYSATNNNAVRLSVTGMQGGRIQSLGNFTAGSLLALRREHPDEVRQYLTPIIRDFTGADYLRPGPADVYRAFEIAADPKVAGKVRELLERLDSDDFAVREKASAELVALGPPAVVAVARLDPDTLTAEQGARLTAFMAGYARREFDSAAAARADQSFLLECLEDDDLTVRNAAKSSLEAAIGRALDLDTALPGEKLTRAVRRLRDDLTAKPATAPAPGPVEVGNINRPVN